MSRRSDIQRPMSRPSDIKRLHGLIASDLREPLKQTTEIKQLQPNRWQRSRVGVDVVFYLMGREQDFSCGTPILPMLPLLTGQAISELAPTEARPWVAWSDKWTKQQDDSFLLLAAGWTLFWGELGGRKVKILRAEWDARSFRDGGGAEAAQPHWHVDPLLLLQDSGAGSRRAGELQELQPSAVTFGLGSRLSIQRVHLAMGGWNHSDSHPECWQIDFTKDERGLRGWAMSTLRYLQSQAALLRSYPAGT